MLFFVKYLQQQNERKIMKTVKIKKFGIILFVSIMACMFMFMSNIDKSYADSGNNGIDPNTIDPNAVQQSDFRDGTIDIDGINYSLDYDNYTAKVLGPHNNIKDVTLPSVISFDNKNFKVNLICRDAFRNSRLQSIVIPGSVNNIGQSAFEGCRQLSSVTILESKENILMLLQKNIKILTKKYSNIFINC